MTRRALITSGGALLATAAVGLLPLARRAEAQSTAGGAYDWPISSLRAGGTTGVPTQFPAPVFRANPQCVVTTDKILGPCHTNDVPIRYDVTDGVAGLPMRVSLRVVAADTCKPIAGADVEIWHADVRGVYSGRAAAMCNPGDEPAKDGGFLRGRQITGSEGVASFLTIYPGWYGGRATHIHLRILVKGRELLITQLLFDDVLNDLIYGEHPDYAGRPQRRTMNNADFVFTAAEVERFIFDVERLDSGILQASYTIGLAGVAT